MTDAPRTLSEKVWDRHVVHTGTGDEPDVIFIDLHLIHEVTSPQAFDGLRLAGRGVHRPDLTIATADHNVPTVDIDKPVADPISAKQLAVLASNCSEFGITCYPMGHANQGIVHIIGPEQGLTQPGMTIVCGDSHTSTHGAFGALAFGIGTSEVEHVLATQTLPQHRPASMAVTVDGELPAGVTAKDLVLAVIGQIGTGGGSGHIIEYRGPAVRGLSMEGRMTVCNMSIEAGARAGMIAPDDVTFAYLEGRDHAPKGAAWEAALDEWRRLPTDEGATFDREVHVDASGLAPYVTWGTNPAQVTRIDGSVPDPPGARGRPRTGGGRPGPRVHGVGGRDAHARHRRRHRVHRLVHQRSHRGPAGRRRRAAGPHGAVRIAGHGGPRVPPGQGPGRVGGTGRGLHRGRLRLAGAGVLDVPGHEPRQAGAGGTGGVDVQPQLRGAPGPGRAHPPGLAGRGRGHGGGRTLRHTRGARL